MDPWVSILDSDAWWHPPNRVKAKVLVVQGPRDACPLVPSLLRTSGFRKAGRVYIEPGVYREVYIAGVYCTRVRCQGTLYPGTSLLYTQHPSHLPLYGFSTPHR